MVFFDFFKKNESPTTDLTFTCDNDDDDSKSKIGAGVALDASIKSSTIEANIKYSRPCYNPKTRKQFYDDGRAHKKAIDNAFSSGKTVIDSYSGTKLVKKQVDAKMQYGKDWQSHSAEADHIDPLSQITKRTKNNPFLTTDNIREIGNSDENFQVLSRRLNQGSNDIGKGGSTQQEWADDAKRMEGLSDTIETGESINEVSKRIKDIGNDAEKRNNSRAFNKSVKNAAWTFHDAGKAGAQNAGVTALTMSTIMNVISVIKGEKSSDDAIADTITDGGKAAVIGYAMGGGMTVVSQILSYSSSEFIQALAKNNVPGKVIASVIVMGDTLKKWGEGEISTEECLIQIGDKGLNVATMGYSMAVGQALIPIPVVGAAVGALVGSMLTSGLYNDLINELKTKQLEHEERIRIIEESNAVAEQIVALRTELESYLNSYFEEYKTCFDSALSNMKLAYGTGDVAGVILSANDVTRKLGGEVKFETIEEFKSFLDRDEDDIL